MEFNRLNRLALFGTLALMVSALSARPSTISITGSTLFGADVDYGIDFSGPGLGLSISTCDASDPLGWTTPMTFTASSGCSTGSASYRSYTWTTSYSGFAPDEIIANVTGVTENCGSMMVNPDGTWSGTCSASFSGNLEAFPTSGPAPHSRARLLAPALSDFPAPQFRVFSMSMASVQTSLGRRTLPAPCRSLGRCR